MSESTLYRVLEDVADERRSQDRKWGGASHDDTHEYSDWINLIRNYADMRGGQEIQRKRLVQIAALAVSGAETLDRKAQSEITAERAEKVEAER